MGTVFHNNTQVNAFDKDSVHFTGLTSIANRIFYETYFRYVRLPFASTIGTSTSGNYSVFYYAESLLAVRLDAVTKIMAFNYMARRYRYTVITTTTVPSLGVSDSRHYNGATYVIDSLVDSYRAATNWSSKTIRPISQLPTDYPDCPWLDDLREKGFIS